MVPASGGAIRPGSVRPLNSPRPVRVRLGPHGEPCGVIRSGKLLPVTGIRDRWRVDDRWWTEEPVCRMYWELELENGEILTLFQDRIDHGWYRQRHTIPIACQR